MTNCQVYSYPNNQINSISFSLLCRRGATSEKNNEKGITHLIEHLCFRKAGELTQSQIYSIAESNGVNVCGKTGKNYLEISFSCRPEVFDDMVKLVSKMWFETEYSQEDVSAEQKVICKEISVKEQTNKDVILNKLWDNSLLGCGVLGTQQSLHSFTAEQVTSYKKALLSTNTTVVVAGNFTEENIATVGNEIVSRFVAVDDNEIEYEKQILNEDKLVFVKDRFSPVDIYYSFHTTIGNSKEKYIEILTLEDILFGGNAGYLVERLRDKFGYIYEIESTVEIVDGEVCWIAKLSCDKEDANEVVASMERLLTDVSFLDCYMKYVKAFYCDNLPMLLDRSSAICDCITNGIVAIGEVVTPQDFAMQCKTPNVTPYKKLLVNLVSNRRIYIFGNISHKSSKELKKTVDFDRIYSDVD